MRDIDQLREHFLTHLSQSKIKGNPPNLYDPVNYLMGLGGKRMRPILLLMAYELFDDDISRAMDAALAIEMFHNFTLAHDDIMDEADVRRGQPSMHAKYGVNAAILSGDIMMIKSYELLKKETRDADWGLVFDIFNKAAVQICEGQQMDIDFERRRDVDVDEYITMIKFKTAVLLGAAMHIGATLGGGSKKNSKALYNFAIDLGIAFQINDDILDTFGDPSKVGKKIGGDIIQNKKTLLWITCQSLLSEEDEALFQSLIALTNEDNDKKVEGMKTLYKKYKVQDAASNLMKRYYKSALSHLDTMSVEEPKLDYLKKFATQLMNREN